MPDPAQTPDTVTEALTLLAADGYVTDLSPRAGVVHCGACGEAHGAGDAVIDRTFRFEGASDPDDEAIVLALRCPRCGRLGVLVAGYGPSADPADIDLLVALTDGRR